jgi:hypothetical protein
MNPSLLFLNYNAAFEYWYRGSESNRHYLRNRILNPARLPVPPPRQYSSDKL